MRIKKHYVDKRDKWVIDTWKDYSFNESMSFSYRNSVYTSENYPSSLHFHDYYELLVILEGDIHYVHDRDIYYPQKGDIILIPPGHLHCSKPNSEKTNYKRYVFYFYSNFLDELGADILLDFAVNLPKNHFYFAPSHSTMNEIISLNEKLLAAFEKNTPADLLLAKSYILQLFYILNSLNWDRPVKSEGLPSILRDILKYLDKNYTQPLSIADISERFFYSPEHISKLFRKHLNITYTNYILNKRIAFSQKLMETDLSLTDICFQTGFGSLSSFNRAFHKITGMSPSQYRKNIRP